MSIWHKIGLQLQHPQGLMGQITGYAMRLLNTKPNKLAIEALSIQPSDHILELGFGPGQAIAYMARQAPGGKIYGIDASATMLAQAVKRNKRGIATGQISLWVEEFSRLTLANDSLNKILAVNVIYFWKDAATVLKECHRMLSPGGKISIYATDASTMQNWKFASTGTHTLYNADSLRAALLHGGFAGKDINIKTFNLPTGIKGLLATGQKSTTPILQPNQ